MIRNIIFDIGSVVAYYDEEEVLNYFSKSSGDKEFIRKNILNTPEWKENSLIDTGFLSWDNLISIINDRTNHYNDELVKNVCNNHYNFLKVNIDVINLIKKLKENNYNVYLLSNINTDAYNKIKPSGLFDIVSGYVLSHEVHQIKPYNGIYNSLINKYDLDVSNSLFIDDLKANINTAISLGFNAKVVKKNDFNSLCKILKSYNIKF